MREIYADWLNTAAARGDVQLSQSAQDCAAAITAALKGAKSVAPNYESYVATLKTLAVMFAGGLSRD